MDRPLVGVCLCIRRNDGKILLHKRKGKHAPGTWAFTGGHLEKWESFEECVLREMREEVGDVNVTKPVYWTTVNTLFRDEDKHYVVVCMVCDYISGEPRVMESDKCECWEWYSWDNLPSPLMKGLQILKDNDINPFNYHIGLDNVR